TPDTETEFLERTMASIERNRSKGRAAAAPDEWRSVAAALTAFDGPLDDQLSWFGMPLPARGVLISRAFETWLHTDDIRVATGRDRRVPSESTLGLMSDVAVHLLPVSLNATGYDVGHAVARVVLTGDGCGTGDLVLGESDFEAHGAPGVIVTADTVHFFRLAVG